MVVWTSSERQCINGLWGKVNQREIGGESLARLLIVYPWTQRYFTKFGNLGSHEAILHNAAVINHGEKVLRAIGDSIPHMDDLKSHLARLSEFHSESLHVDPANFGRFCGVLSIIMAKHFSDEFNPVTQAAFEKLFQLITEALGRCYH